MENEIAADIIWDLGDLYSGPSDEQIGADTRLLGEKVSAFSTYRGTVALLGPEELLQAILEKERIEEFAQKLLAYAYLNFSTRTADSAASALFQSMIELSSEIRRDTLFFELEWAKLDDARAGHVASAPVLSKYSHYLVSLRRYKPHLLSEPEERVLADKTPAGASAWGVLFDKMLGQLRFGEKKRTESEVLSDLYSPEREVRETAAAELSEGLQSALLPLTHIFNTILLDKSIDDRLRRYPHWLSARNLGNEAGDAMVEALVETVCSRYDLVGRYYRLKRRLLGYEELFDYDRYVPVTAPVETTISWAEAKEIVLASYAAFSPEMADIASRFFTNGWIHALPMPGKRNGAFAHPVVPSSHPYVFLNFTGSRRDVMVLAHELGHGVHQYLARAQGLFNSETPLYDRQSASVFGEMFLPCRRTTCLLKARKSRSSKRNERHEEGWRGNGSTADACFVRRPPVDDPRRADRRAHLAFDRDRRLRAGRAHSRGSDCRAARGQPRPGARSTAHPGARRRRSHPAEPRRARHAAQHQGGRRPVRDSP